MFFRYLDGLREKPRAHRVRFAFLSALSFTAVVALFFVVSLPSKFASLNFGSQQAGVGDASLEDLKSAGAGIQDLVNTAELFQDHSDDGVGFDFEGELENQLHAFDEGTLFDHAHDSHEHELHDTHQVEEIIQEPENTAKRRVLIATTSSESGE